MPLYLLADAQTGDRVIHGFDSVAKARTYGEKYVGRQTQIVPYDGHPSWPGAAFTPYPAVATVEPVPQAPHVPDGFDAWIAAGGTTE